MANENAKYQRTLTDIYGKHIFDVREIENMTEVALAGGKYVFIIYLEEQHAQSMKYTDLDTARLQRFSLWNLWRAWEATDGK